MSTKFILCIFILGLISIINSADIDTSKTYQTIKGFGGMNHPDWIADLTTDQVNKAFKNGDGE